MPDRRRGDCRGLLLGNARPLSAARLRESLLDLRPVCWHRCRDGPIYSRNEDGAPNDPVGNTSGERRSGRGVRGPSQMFATKNMGRSVSSGNRDH